MTVSTLTLYLAFSVSRLRNRQARVSTERLRPGLGPWFVFPLQLETDYQLRVHSPFNSQKEAIASVIESFTKWAGTTNRLVIKSHPLENGLISWRRFIEAKAKEHGVEDRILFCDGGDLGVIMQGSQGIVTVNSTAALSGLRQGIATIVLGSAIFDVPGLTHQGTLDDFWLSPSPPDSDVKDAFVKLIAASIHERGNFYSIDGVAHASGAVAKRLLENTVNKPGADAGYLPRSRPIKNGRIVDF